MSKKGSHIGFVLSFMIFILFLTFMYSILKPAIIEKEEKEFLVNSLKTNLIENISANFTTLTLTIDDSIIEKCIVLENILANEIPFLGVLVKDDSRNILPSYISESDSNDLVINRDSSSDIFFKLYGSEEFETLSKTGISGCSGVSNYEVSLLKSDKYISEKKIIELNEDYYNDYENVKSFFNFPVSNNFGFGMVWNNGSSIETSAGESSGNIYVKEIPIRYVDSNANILTGTLRLKVW